MSRIYLCRHGEAHNSSPTGSDDDRTLTLRGRDEADHLAEWLAALEHPPTMLCASPILRAQQTAERIGAALGIEILTDPELSTESTPSRVLEAVVRRAHPGDVVAFVGHNPSMSALTAVFLEGPTGGGIPMSTGQVVGLTIDPAAPIGSGKDPVTERLGAEVR